MSAFVIMPSATLTRRSGGSIQRHGGNNSNEPVSRRPELIGGVPLYILHTLASRVNSGIAGMLPGLTALGGTAASSGTTATTTPSEALRRAAAAVEAERLRHANRAREAEMEVVRLRSELLDAREMETDNAARKYRHVADSACTRLVRVQRELEEALARNNELQKEIERLRRVVDDKSADALKSVAVYAALAVALVAFCAEQFSS